MKTIALFSALAIGALTSAAMAEPVMTTAAPAKTAASQQAGRVELNDSQMDKLKGGYVGTHTVYNNGNNYTEGYSGNSNQYHYHNPCC